MSNHVEALHDMEQVKVSHTNIGEFCFILTTFNVLYLYFLCLFFSFCFMLISTKERNPIPPPIPPAKPLRSQQYSLNSEPRKCLSNMPNHEHDQFQSLSDKQAIYNNIVNNNPTLTAVCHPLRDQSRFCKSSHALNYPAEMPIGCLNPKTTNERVLLHNTNEFNTDSFPHMLRQRSQTECSPQWSFQPAKKPSGANNNRHWLIQEAEQRRIEQQANIYHSTAGYSQNVPRKSLPDSVIQTITQRVQTLGIGTDRRW